MKILHLIYPSAMAMALVSMPSQAGTLVPVSEGADVAVSTDGNVDLTSGISDVELDAMFDNGGDSPNSDGIQINRGIAVRSGQGVAGHSSARAKSNPSLVQTFDGVNFHDQRYANGGNNFSIEPPDQALCVGNGFVFESTNDVMRIFDGSGRTLVGPLDLNAFYGYPPAINRRTGARGPSITDPTCLFDQDTQRFFHVVLTIERTGKNHLDIAVSKTNDPRQGFTVRRIPVQNDGSQGTPNHHCPGGPCLGDYPHIGADANALFITTNEFALFAPGFNGAQVYAISKRGLVNNTALNAVLFDPSDGPYLDGAPGFTVWPATAAPGSYESANNGTEYFLSSQAVFNDNGYDNRLRKWSVTNTAAIDTTPEALTLSSTVVQTEGYAVGGRSQQKAGNVPLRDCIASAPCAASIGATPYYNRESVLDSGDSRMQQVFLANGKLWGGLDTGLLFDDGSFGNGIAYFVINPNADKVVQQGYVGLAHNNVNYPAIAVNDSGRGVIAFTVVGDDFFPSAGYTSLDAKVGAGDIHVAAEGKGPQDGFSGYRPFSNRPRWGDYGAAALDGSSIWVASEYIAQTCTFAEYNVASPAGRRFTCGETRGALGNWGTRVTQLGF